MGILVQSLVQAFWEKVLVFAYGHWRRPGDREPVGIPGRRDPGAPCEGYEPGKRDPRDWTGCGGDGHYLCRRCVHRSGT